jgi:hypothetical protein
VIFCFDLLPLWQTDGESPTAGLTPVNTTDILVSIKCLIETDV